MSKLTVLILVLWWAHVIIKELHGYGKIKRAIVNFLKLYVIGRRPSKVFSIGIGHASRENSEEELKK